MNKSYMSLVTGVLVYALLSYSLTSNMLIPLLPALEHSYGISPVTAIWVTLIALLAGAAFVPTLCRLDDTLGWKKSMTIIGLGCLLVGGVIAAVSTTVPLLLVGRAFQGVSLLAFPMIAGIVNDEFTVTRRKVAISLLSATLFFGSGAGGVIASLLVEHAASFRIVFWLAALLPQLAIPLVAVFIPRGRGPAPDAPANRWRVVDLAGAARFAIPVIALDIAFSMGPTWGWTSARIIGLYVAAAVVLVGWVIVERRIPSPLVEMKIFWSRTVWVNNAVSVLAGFGIFGAAVATATFVQMPPVPGVNGLGKSTVVAALIVLPAEWVMLVVGPLVGYVSRLVGKGPLLTGGALVEALGLFLVIAFHGSTAVIVLAMTVVGIGVGSVAAWFGLIYVEDIPPEHVGRLFASRRPSPREPAAASRARSSVRSSRQSPAPFAIAHHGGVHRLLVRRGGRVPARDRARGDLPGHLLGRPARRRPRHGPQRTRHSRGRARHRRPGSLSITTERSPARV